RVRNVIGVQTCALPISLFFGLGLVDYTLYYLIVALFVPVSFYDFNTLTIPNHMSLLFLITGLYLTELYYIEPIRDFSIILLLHRSEESRVGKEVKRQLE